MATTLNTTLKAIELAKNPIPVELETDNYITSYPANPYLHITIDTQGNVENDTIRIGPVTFTTKTTPATDGTEIPRGDLYASLNDWTAAICDYMNYNTFLITRYRIWSSANNIYFEGREAGSIGSSDLRLLASASPVDMTEVAYSEGEDEVSDLTVKMILKLFVFVEERTDFVSGTYDYFEHKKTIELEPLYDNTNLYFIEGGLLPYFSNEVLPSFSQAAVVKNDNVLLKYYLQYNESSGTPPEETETQKTDVLYALNGGFKRKDYLDYNFHDDVFNDSNPKFLTWVNTVKYITKEQLDYLHFINLEGATIVTIVFRATFADNTTEIKNVSIGSPVGYGCYIIPVNFGYITSLSYSQEVVSLEIFVSFVTGSGITLSETKGFKFIQNKPLMAKYFLFKNSLGVFESIMFTGEKVLSNEIDKQTADRILSYDDVITTHQKITANVTWANSYKIYTGFKSQAELNRFVEFLKSEEVYEQTDTYWKPVFVNAKKVKLYGEQDFVESVAVEIVENSEKNYSNVS